MSVIVTVRMAADPKKFEEFAGRNSELLRSIADNGKEHGVIAHRFYGSDSGQIMVIDEWPDAQSFHTFFESEQGRIGPMMQEVGVQSEPEVTVWHKLESHDEVGWGSS
jgi:quinol monooxygenase YgiN